jgi:hypothetical protein
VGGRHLPVAITHDGTSLRVLRSQHPSMLLKCLSGRALAGREVRKDRGERTIANR